VTKGDGVVVKRASAIDPDTAAAAAAAAKACAGGGHSADAAAVESAMREANGKNAIFAMDAAVAASHGGNDMAEAFGVARSRKVTARVCGPQRE
jgi:hypothetical protein